LLVLYVEAPVDPAVLDRLVATGGTRVTSRNPYWDRWGVTLADPDGYRLVVSQQAWSNANEEGRKHDGVLEGCK